MEKKHLNLRIKVILFKGNYIFGYYQFIYNYHSEVLEQSDNYSLERIHILVHEISQINIVEFLMI